jgi:outer membrane biosynthesis protein TonB
MRLGSFLACAAVAPLLMAASQPVRLQPSSPWVVDYDANSCRLVRKFGQGKDETKLAFESEAPGEMDMVVIGRPLETYQEEIAARFLPVSAKPLSGRVNRTADTHQPAVLWLNPPMVSDEVVNQHEVERQRRPRDPRVRPPARDLAQLAAEKAERVRFTAAATELALQPLRGHEVILETGSLGAAFAKFDECNEDSLRDWGVDPAVEAKIVRPLWATNPSGWLFASDYPSGLAARGAESVVEVRLLVDAAGRVTKCTPLSHFDEPEFNRVSCARITERARFEPAELADGTKVPSYFTRRIVFRMGR